MDFEGSEKCDRIGSFFFLLYISDVGREKMKNVRCLPLNWQDFCLMWLLQ